MNARHSRKNRFPVRPAFTLTELLVVIMLISILSSTMLFALWGAIEEAKAARTKAQITKLHDMIMTRWDSYRTRAVRWEMNTLSVVNRQGLRQNARSMATARLNFLRDLMRMEMPDRRTDVTDDPVQVVVTYGNPATAVTLPQLAIPSLQREYRRRATQNNTRPITDWTTEYQDCECLYMIIASIRDLNSNGLDFLQEGEIGDLDGDGMNEILDAWGRPIAFLRWPAGFVVHPGLDQEWGASGADDDTVNGTDDFGEAGWPGSDDIPYYTDLQQIILAEDPTTGAPLPYVAPEARDPFDPLRVDNRAPVSVFLSPASTSQYYFNFATYPLVCSSGPDQQQDIVRYDYDPTAPTILIPFNYFRGVANPVQNDPYSIMPNSARRLGEPFLDSVGYADNIHNHALGGQ